MISLMTSLLMVQTNFKREEYRAKSPSKSSMALTTRVLRRWTHYLFRRKLIPTRSCGSTTCMGVEDDEVGELFSALMVKVGSLTLRSPSRSHMITSIEAIGWSQRLGDLSSLADPTLDLLIILLVELFRVLKVMSWPTFSLIPTKRPISSGISLGKEVSSMLSSTGSQKWKRSRGETSQVDAVEELKGMFLMVAFQAWFKTK